MPRWEGILFFSIVIKLSYSLMSLSDNTKVKKIKVTTWDRHLVVLKLIFLFPFFLKKKKSIWIISGLDKSKYLPKPSYTSNTKV